jgi:hypothetical protein
LRFIKVVAQIQELARRHRMYRSIASTRRDRRPEKMKSYF